MPAAVPLLAAIGGGSAAAGAVTLAGTGAALYGAAKDRKIASQNQDMSAQERSNSLGYIQDQTNQAQNYLTGAFPQMQQATNRGYTGALEALQGSIPLQLGAISQGAQDAQRFQLGSLPFIQQALMGQKMDMSQLAPYVQKSQIPFNPNIASNLIQKYGPQAQMMRQQMPQTMPQEIDPALYQQWQGY
jgi:hypothetical protein